MAVTPRSSAAALINEEVANEIIKDLPRQSSVLTLPIRRRTASKAQVRVPVADVLPSAYWVEEGAVKTETTASWANKTIDIRELAAIVRVHEDVLDDSDYDLWAEIQPQLVEAIGKKIDQAVLFGTDAPSAFPNSIVEDAVAKGQVWEEHNGTVDFAEDVNKAFGLVEADGFLVNGAAARIGVKQKLRGLRDENGQPIFLSELRGDGRTDSIYGEPLSFSQNGSWNPSAAEMIVGDWSKLLFVIRKDITWKVSDTAVVGGESTFERDEVALRVTFRCGFLVLNPPTAENPTEATRYPFAVVANQVANT